MFNSFSQTFDKVGQAIPRKFVVCEAGGRKWNLSSFCRPCRRWTFGSKVKFILEGVEWLLSGRNSHETSREIFHGKPWSCVYSGRYRSSVQLASTYTPLKSNTIFPRFWENVTSHYCASSVWESIKGWKLFSFVTLPLVRANDSNCV